MSNDNGDDKHDDLDPTLDRPLGSRGQAREAIGKVRSPVRRGGGNKKLGGGIPKQFGRYRIEKKLGQGGMGAVYLAHDQKLDRRVAIKIPSFRRHEDKLVIERFYREARAAATLDHPNLCPVYDVGVISGIHYLSMAYVSGRPLSTFIKPGGLPSRQVAALVRKIAIALHEAHQKGIVHRDLKPANIMINRRRQPVVMDFGLAQRLHGGDPKLTQTGAVVGTPAYMSPEQISTDGPVGAASDIFSLGIILYEMLVGQTPFKGSDAYALVGAILTVDPEAPSSLRPDLEPELEAICLRALRKDPEQRFASMSELAESLRHFIVGNTVPATTELATPPAQSADAPRTEQPTDPPATGNAGSASPGEETLIHDMFADISSTSGTSKRLHRNRRNRRKRRNRSMWILGAALVGVAIFFFIAFRAVQSTRTERSGQNRQASLSGSANPQPSDNSGAESTAPASRPPSEAEASEDSGDSQSAVNAQPAGSSRNPPPTSVATPTPPPAQSQPPTSATSAKPTQTKTSPVQPPTKDRPLMVNAGLPADAASKIQIDGKADDWKLAAALSDDQRDALDNQWSRDIVEVASEYTADSLYLMLRTSQPPSTENLAFWVNIDLNDDRSQDFQIGLSRHDRHVLWRSPPGAKGWSSTVSGAQFAIDDVVEIRIPWDQLQTDIPDSMKHLLRKDSAPLGVNCQCFTHLSSADKRIDSTVFLVSRSLLTEDQRLAAIIAETKRLGPPKWESIWVRDANTPWDLRTDLTKSNLESSIRGMRRKRLTLTCLRTYTGDDGQPRFAALWTTGSPTEVAYGLSEKELRTRLSESVKNRIRPVFVSAWPYGRETMFNALWVPNVPAIPSIWVFSDRATLNRDYQNATDQKLGIQGVTVWPGSDGEFRYLSLFAGNGRFPGSRIYDEADYRQNVQRLAVNARPVYVDMFRNVNSMFFPVCWTYDNDQVSDWRVESSQGVAGFQQLVTRLRRENYRPLCIAVAR